MRIIHFSDTHLTDKISDFSGYFDKRLIGYANFILTRHGKFPVERLQNAIYEIVSLNPEIVVCTGDIVSLSEPAEFDKFIEICSPLLENENIHFLYVPGNHDAYVKRTAPYLQKAFRVLNQNKFKMSDMPVIKKIRNLSFFLANESIPTNIFLSCGYLNSKIKEKFQDWIFSNREPNEKRILVGHYPCFMSNGKPLSWRRSLKGYSIVADALKDNQLDLLLCGHIHQPYINQYGKTMEICSGSLTMNGVFNIIDINPTSGKIDQYWQTVNSGDTLETSMEIPPFPA
ncbi:MAG: metallophosphoesterase [Verrucomicrobiota bacterium]|nr:metallophosphoesterase [Verrucomicrobiota bacterium]